MTDYSKITALYSRLSVGDEDRDGGESNSIQNQKIFLENYATLSGQRTAEYTKLKETRAEVAELHNIRKCVDIALKADQPEQTRAKRHEQER